MKTLDEIRAFFKDDLFVMGQGITIDSVESDKTVCSVVLEKRHTNAMGTAQGGLIYTLADFTFAVAANCARLGTVTLTSHMNYFKSPKSGRLIATARCRNMGRTTCAYDVDVTDEEGHLLAMAVMTGYAVKMPESGAESKD